VRRRLLLALVGLTAAILVGAVIPLGYKASAHDYSGYMEDAQSRARMAAADNGPGMSQAEMDRAFRRFAASAAGGSGLGLAIVDRLASSSGGSARLARTEGGGLTVIVDLPRATPARLAPPGPMASRAGRAR